MLTLVRFLQTLDDGLLEGAFVEVFESGIGEDVEECLGGGLDGVLAEGGGELEVEAGRGHDLDPL